MNIVSFEKAISLLYGEKARALDGDYVQYDFKDWLDFSNRPNHFAKINSVNMRICLPHIIALKTYSRLFYKEKGVTYSRENIFERDGFRCAYCLNKFSAKELSIDHILPVSRSGPTSYENCVSACKPCNNRKANRTPEQAGMPLLIKPTIPKWSGKGNKIPDIVSWTKYMNYVESNASQNPTPEEQ